MKLDKKLSRLKKILSKMNSLLLAYSAGADSTFLLKIAKDTVGHKVLAVTADSATYPKEELTFSKQMCRQFKVKQMIIKTQELDNPQFLNNPQNRCYFCKRELFSKLKNIAKRNNINFVIDATNFSDKNDFRPGNQAKKELGIRSPLEEARITKEDIRKLSKNLRLSSWNKPSLACLASRIPYGRKITKKILKRIDAGERFIRTLGFREVRLRHYNGLARIEVLKQDIPRIIKMRGLLIDRLKKLGYNYVTIDLEGYRSGSLNIGVKRR